MRRTMSWTMRLASLAIVILILIPGVVAASENADESRDSRVVVPKHVLETLPEGIRDQLYRAAPDPERPAMLPVFYASLGVLQGLDAYTTSKNLTAGASELNPLLQPVSGNVTAMTAVKVAATVASIVVAEKLWKRNRTAAILSMVVSNAIMTSVVASNFQNRPR